RPTVSTKIDRGRPLPTLLDGLDPQDHRNAMSRRRDLPQLAAAAEGIADARGWTLGPGVNLGGVVWIPDLEGPSRHRRQYSRQPRRENGIRSGRKLPLGTAARQLERSRPTGLTFALALRR